MKRNPLFGITALLVIGCDHHADPSSDADLKVSFSECRTAVEKAAADAPLARLTYASKDSLDFTIPSLSVQCGSEYVFTYPSVINGDELRMKMERSHDSGARCLCAKDVRIGIKSKGDDFTGIKKVNLNGIGYDLNASG
jgi:hypothetical protein